MAVNNWSTIKGIRQQLCKKWEQGVFCFVEDAEFPYVVGIKGPGSSELAEKFAVVQDWLRKNYSEFSTAQYKIIWQEKSHRVTGKNLLPVSLSFQSMEKLCGFMGRNNELLRWEQAKVLIADKLPELIPWAQRYKRKALSLSADLKKLEILLRISCWYKEEYLKRASCQKLYLRQISLSGVHTKFIESNKGVLSEWWFFLGWVAEDFRGSVVPDSSFSPLEKFVSRFGFKNKPVMTRFRILDEDLYVNGLSDIMVNTEELCSLELPVKRVFICENDVSTLSFPKHKESIVIYGRGYGFEALSQVEWLHKKELWYWGDIDTDGFCILEQFRRHFPGVKSFLMNQEILLEHRDFWSEEKKQSIRELQSLSNEEMDLYKNLCANKWGQSVRLEQEFIQFRCLEEFLGSLECN
jgi:hypothetical protein